MNLNVEKSSSKTLSYSIVVKGGGIVMERDAHISKNETTEQVVSTVNYFCRDIGKEIFQRNGSEFLNMVWNRYLNP